MDKGTLMKEIQSIQRQGFLQKQSRFLKSWRQRWVVLTPNFIFTFKERREYQSPTEVVVLKQILAIKAVEDQSQQNTFKVQNNETAFIFAADSNLQKEGWIGAIGKAMVKSSNSHLRD